MPSHLRLQSSFEPFSAETTRSYFPTAAPPAKKQKMSLSQTYYIAASARTKLTHEAQKSDHDLRLLVGHANLLDSLMLELADAEREQEAWFNKTVNKAARAERHIQWADTIDEEVMEDDDEEDEEDDDIISDSESDSDYEEDDSDFDMIAPLRRIPSPPVRITTTELEDDDEEEDDEEDEYYEDEEFDDEHALVRSPSQQTPPELVHEEDSDSDDDATPTTPPQPTIEYSEKERQAIATTAYLDGKESQLQTTTPDQAAFLQESYFLERRNAPLITSY
ncbi:hypothetical protein UCDDS831_g04451 [Diplodia seriata]|uniref:Uncharacterized protein n=1 Tax=Diplodia seriata TaxID=420778 RepID=A0A0G2EFC1_9PEZI|nr:hypothetical protein UCDDS831_g04451 [Diplodia seriata]